MIRLFAGLVLLSSVLAAEAAWVKIDGREAHPTRVLAKFKQAPNLAQLAGASNFSILRLYPEFPRMAEIQLKDQAALANALAGDADPAAKLKKTIADLKASGMFEYVYPDYVGHFDLQPTDARFLDGTLWGLLNNGQQGGKPGADINVVPAWDVTTGDTNFIVAVCDSGANLTHLDLVNQFWRNPGEIPGNGIDDDNNGIVDDVFGIDAVADNGNPLDTVVGHGTHVAGTIGAAANDGHEHVGVMWKVQLMIVKIGDDSGILTSDAIQGINYVLSKNVKISNHSWGGFGDNQPLLDVMTAARAKGHLFICAAGNDGLNLDTFPLITFPAGFGLDNIISVASLNRFDELSFFSNYGRNSVDIGAPGEEIFSTWIGSDTAYNTIQGTSMATPHVCGAAALIWSTDFSAPYSDVRDRIFQGATPIPALAGKSATGGRLNTFGSLGGNIDGILELSVIPPSGSYFGIGSRATIQVRVRDVFNVNDANVVGRFNNTTVNFLNNGVAPDVSTNDGIYSATVTMPSVAGTYTLSIDVQAPGKLNGHIDASYQVLNPPANDHFAQATKFPAGGGIKDADNRLATPEPGATPGNPGYGPDLGEPLHAGISNVRSLWWSWSTPNSTPVIVDTAGTSFDDDAVLGVYTGASVSTLTQVGSGTSTVNGPNGTRAPFLKFTAQPNLTYWIAVAQSQLGTNSPGNVIVRVEPNGELDTTPPTLRVTNILSGTFIRSTNNAITLSGMAEDPLPNASGVASVQVKGPFDLVFGKVNGTTNWTSGPILLTNGVNSILVTAFDRADNQALVTEFTVTYIPQQTPNDLFGDSTTLLGNSGVTTANNANATKEFGEPAHAGNEGGHSLWWNYRPTADGVLVLSTEGSSFDTLLALYTVNDETVDRSVSSATLVASNDDLADNSFSELSATVYRGRLYYIAVDGYGQQTGNIRLEYHFAPLSIFTVTNLTTSGGTVTPPGTNAFPAGSALTVTAVPDRYQQFKDFQVTMRNPDTGETTTQTVRSNPYTFEVDGGTTVVAEFERKQFADDFETGDFSRLPWQVPGNNWRVQSVVTNETTQASSRVARTVELPNGASASLVLVTNLLAGAGSFEYRVSTETNFDKVEFLRDGFVLATWSGEIPWTLFTFDIPPKDGPTRLEWRYTKDFAGAAGADAVFIDNLDLNFAPPPPVVISISSTPPTITANGPPGADLQLQSSTDLVNWIIADEKTANSSGVAMFTLPALSGTQTFYQVKRL